MIKMHILPNIAKRKSEFYQNIAERKCKNLPKDHRKKTEMSTKDQ